MLGDSTHTQNQSMVAVMRTVAYRVGTMPEKGHEGTF